MALMGANIPWGQFFAHGNRGRALFRMGGAGAAMGLVSGGADWVFGGDHPGRAALYGFGAGALAGAAGHLAMGGRSMRAATISGWEHMAQTGMATADDVARAIEQAKRIPNIF